MYTPSIRFRSATSSRPLALILVFLLILTSILVQRPVGAVGASGSTTRVSIASDGAQGNERSGYFHGRSIRAISSDGRFVAFESAASNLVPGDSDNTYDIFVHNRETNQTTLVSVASDGSQANGRSTFPTISADGRFVAFQSLATNLVLDDHNEQSDVFVHDMITGSTIRVSVASDGSEGFSNTIGASGTPSISGDGRYVAFESYAMLVPGNTASDSVYVHDIQSRETRLISVASDGTSGSHSYTPSISEDGRYVAFLSIAPLVQGDTNGVGDIFIHDMETRLTTRVSVASDGTQADAVGSAGWPSISGDGRYVSFASLATNLVPNDTNNGFDTFVHDTETGQTTRVSVASDGSQVLEGGFRHAIAANGRYVVFDSGSNNLTPGDTNSKGDIFVHDMATRQTDLVSVALNGAQGDDISLLPTISGDGRYVAFASLSSNLVENDTNAVFDVFVRDLAPPTVQTYVISGKVTVSSSLNNTGVPGVTIEYGSGQVVTTDSNGDYSISGLSAGDYILTASKSGYSFDPPSRRIEVTQNTAAQDFKATLTSPPSPTVLDLDVVSYDTLIVADSQYSPNPFEIAAVVTNNGTSPAKDVLLALHTLPTGLSLAEGSPPATLLIGDLAPGEKRGVTWLVQAALQQSETMLSYTVSAVAANVEPQSSTRQIKLPKIDVKKVIVLLQGVCTSIEDGTDIGSTFNDLRRLLKNEYGYMDTDFLLYSYKGGRVDDSGVWHHNAYGKEDPVKQDFRTESVSALHDQLLIPYRAKHPNTTFILIGHSLGGMVAFEEVARKVNASNYERGLISTVITVDSPLHGVPPEASITAALIPGAKCLASGISAGILTGIHNNEPQTTKDLQDIVARGKTKGVSVVNIGNSYDCVWEPAWCAYPFMVGNIDTQWIFGSEATTHVYKVAKPCLYFNYHCITGTHSAVLHNKYAPESLKTIADHIGRQN